MIERICQRCSKHFYTFPSRVRVGNAKYCSRNCINGLPRIKMICQQCGKEYETYNCRTQNGRRKYCSLECHYEAQRDKVKRECECCGKEFMVVPSRIAEGGGKYCSPDCSSRGRKGKPFLESHRKRISSSTKQRYLILEEHNKTSKAVRKAFQKPEWKAKASKLRKLVWQNPEHIKNYMRGLRVRPTKPELQLQAILDKHFPQFKYNGDFSLGVTLSGLIPDFVNVNGKKELIEVFGGYWHSRNDIRWNYSELGRIMAFNSVGYRCLVIWASELVDEQAVIDKIKRFVKKRPSPVLRREDGNKSHYLNCADR